MKKRLLKMCAAVLFLTALLPMGAAAAEQKLHVDGEGKVTLTSREAAEDEISTISFSFSIESPGAGDVEFWFAGSNAKIQDYSYDEKEKKLNIYVAGTEPLIPKGSESLDIGRIVIRDSGGSASGTQAAVQMNAGSLLYVYGTELKWMKELEYDGTVQMVSTDKGMETPAPPTPTPTVPAPTPTPAVPTPTPTVPAPTPTPTVPTPTAPVPTREPEVTPEPGESTEDPSEDREEEPDHTPQPTKKPGQTTPAVRTPKPGKTPVPTAKPGKTPKPTDKPDKTAEPSASPEASPEVSPEPAPDEDDDVISASGELTGNKAGNEASGGKMDWVMAAAIIAIVLFVIVAAMAIVVLKRKPGDRADE